MEQTKYDIFISYKRKSLPTANNLYYRLTVRGYSTFFDLEEMGRDNFNMQLLNYIENAKDVFVILEEGSLDACMEDDWEKDWFCHEIAFALEKKKNIIPILIGNYKMPSEEFFPDRLKELSLKNAPEFNFSFFEAYLDKLMEKEFLLSKPNLKEKATSIFKFYSDEKCQVFKEGKLVCSLEGESDTPYYLPVPRKGEYRFKAKNEWDGEKIITASIGSVEEKIIEIKWNDYTVVNTAPPKRKSGIQKIITFFVYCLIGIGGVFMVGVVKDMIETKQKKSSSEGIPTLVWADEGVEPFQDTKGKWGFINRVGEIVIPSKWEKVRDFRGGYAPVQDISGKWGYINSFGDLVIPCKWKWVAQMFMNGYAPVQDSLGKWGFIDMSGDLVIPCKWDKNYYFIGSLARVQDSSGKWGFINKSGDLVIPCKWKNVHVISDGFAAVQNDSGRWGVFNQFGDMLIPCKWHDISYFSQDFAIIQDLDDKYGIINKFGKIAIPIVWDYIGSLEEGLARVQDSSGKWGFINNSGDLVIPCKWNDTSSFSEGLARVQDSSGKWGFINKSGDLVIPCKWNETFGFSEGLARVQNSSGKWGFINKSGDLVIPCKWNGTYSFSEGLAVVRGENGKFGFIDKTGLLVISCQWKFATSFRGGMSKVEDENEHVYIIDKTGKVLGAGPRDYFKSVNDLGVQRKSVRK